MTEASFGKPQAIRAFYIFGLVVAAELACDLYASIGGRGLYADAAPLLIIVYAKKWFFVHFGPRAAVELLRQFPIVLLSKFTSATLLQCGQVLAFAMQAFPTLLCALCWPLAPRGDKGWVLFPLTYLLAGFAATSLHAVGESAIASSYFWILLFLLLFRVRSLKQQVLFFLVCIPAFGLHEGAFLLTGILLIALHSHAHDAVGSAHERLFVWLVSALLLILLIYQIVYVIFPLFPGDRAHILYGLTHLEFAYVDNRFNLPLITGALALLTLFAIAILQTSLPGDRAAGPVKIILAAWLIVAMAAIVIAIGVEKSFSPLAQAQARYQPVFVSAGLAAAMILFRRFRLPDRIWKNAATLTVLISLCAAQAVTNVEATQQWNSYIADLRTTLGQEYGLIPWETRLNVAQRTEEVDWRVFEIAWTVPYMCIIFAPNGIVKSMIDLPQGLTFRPLDPERPDRLPELDGIDFAPYKAYVAHRFRGR
jgi:hypothetical protein